MFSGTRCLPTNAGYNAFQVQVSFKIVPFLSSACALKPMTHIYFYLKVKSTLPSTKKNHVIVKILTLS